MTVTDTADDIKVCPRCGEGFGPRPEQRVGDWRRQTYCSASCASKGDIELPPNVTYRQFDYWCSKGYIRIRGEANPGTGRRRGLAPAEGRVLVILANLVEDGVAPATAARVARDLVYIGQANLGGITIRSHSR